MVFKNGRQLLSDQQTEKIFNYTQKLDKLKPERICLKYD